MVMSTSLTEMPRPTDVGTKADEERFPSTSKAAEWNWSLTDLLADTVSRHADRPFLIRDGAAAVPYGEFFERVEIMASSLAALGVAPGDRVAVILPNGEESLHLWFALARLGAVMVPLNPALVPAEIVPLLAATKSRTLVSDAERLNRIAAAVELPVKIVVGGVGGRGRVAYFDLFRSSVTKLPKAAPLDPLSILYTSGTTGKPKGALLTHSSYVLPAREFRQWMEATPEDRFLGCLPLFHMAGQAFAASAVAAGAALALVDRFRGSRFWSEVRSHRITVVRYLGQMLAVLLNRPPVPEEKRHGLRAIYGGGAEPRVAEAFERRFGVPVVEGYGLTETNTVLRNEIGRRRRGSIGRALPFYDVKIVDDSGDEVPDGSEGEILIRQTQVMMRCYFSDPALTASALTDGWLHTGDLGRRDEDGFFYFAGRSKNLIRRRGEMISPKAVEEVLERHPLIEVAAVVGVPDALGGEEVKAFLLCRGGDSISCRELVGWCRESLADFEIPRYFEFCDDLPRTATHKINLSLLRKMVSLNGRCLDRSAEKLEGETSPSIDGTLRREK